MAAPAMSSGDQLGLQQRRGEGEQPELGSRHSKENGSVGPPHKQGSQKPPQSNGSSKPTVPYRGQKLQRNEYVDEQGNVVKKKSKRRKIAAHVAGHVALCCCLTWICHAPCCCGF